MCAINRYFQIKQEINEWYFPNFWSEDYALIPNTPYDCTSCEHKKHVEYLRIALCVWTSVETKHNQL